MQPLIYKAIFSNPTLSSLHHHDSLQSGEGGSGLPRGRFGGSGFGRGQIRGGDSGHNVCRYFQEGHCRLEKDAGIPTICRTLSENEGKKTQNSCKPELNIMLGRDSSSLRRHVWTIGRLWNGALIILNGEDRDWKQMLPRDLDDEQYHGREHIHTILSMAAQKHDCREFVDLAQTFLSVITHPALLDCLSVDTFVGNLYNYISGSNGSRAIPFFKRLSTNLVDAHPESSYLTLAASLEKTLIAMSTAICELLRREPRATFHDDLPDLVDSLENIAACINRNSTAYPIIIRRIAELRAVISRANGLLSEEEEPQENGISTTVVTSTFLREIVIPRDRHDNDKPDITEVKILPTEDEIRSNHAEFLPSTDPDQPHFLADPAHRHLDTHFRLLRHDIFGELKQALGGLLVAVENDPNVLNNPKFSLGDIRAYSYPKAHIRHVSYDQRLGLEIQISFSQLPLLWKKSRSERRTWWEESRRLEEGILLCFVSLSGTRSSILFFTVSQKHTDPKMDYNLSSDDHQSTISAKLATWNQNNMESLLQLSCQNIRGVLIEFPGVLLATFTPILENLQNMQQLSRLPFRQWILPDRISTHGNTSHILDIPPPLYSRDPDFAFSLNAILKSDNDYFELCPSTLIDDITTVNQLEARISLDPAQATHVIYLLIAILMQCRKVTLSADLRYSG